MVKEFENQSLKGEETNGTKYDSAIEFKPMAEAKSGQNVFENIGKDVYVDINLDALTNNINILKKIAENPNLGIIGVVKAGAYGHGSVYIAKHLKSISVQRLAVATIDEGILLRMAGIAGPIHIFGNIEANEVEKCLKYALTPCASTEEAIKAIAEYMEDFKANDVGLEKATFATIPSGDKEFLASNDSHLQASGLLPYGSININIDTGMGRNGIKPRKLEKFMKLCEEKKIPVDAMFTHFADSPDNEKYTKKQYTAFTKAITKYKDKGIKFHAANSGACINKVGTELDFVRPGIAIYGLPPGKKVKEFEEMGFQPVMSIKGTPSLSKLCCPGDHIGYSSTYICAADEWIATIPIGYADGYWRAQSSKGYVIRDKTGEKCMVVGKVSMDAITVKVEPEPEAKESFTIMTADFDKDTSAVGIAESVDTIPYEVVTRISPRLPKLYRKGDLSFVLCGLDFLSGIY